MGYGPRKKKKDQSLRLKGWDRESWAQLIPKLLDLGAGIVMTGSTEDRADVQSIVQDLPRDRVRSLAGCTNVRELAAYHPESGFVYFSGYRARPYGGSSGNAIGRSLGPGYL